MYNVCKREIFHLLILLIYSLMNQNDEKMIIENIHPTVVL